MQRKRAALEWLHELLETGEDTDPVWAMHQKALSTATAWGTYSQWRTRTAPTPDKEKNDCRECHIEPDWLLIYQIDTARATVTLVRTGTHSDLFEA